tara:strand:- start:12501 stop:13124 length:624 start_codon:yes stop_codon:yes gene_type:complete
MKKYYFAINQYIYRLLKIEDGLGLSESIVSILLLTFLIGYSMYFITMRQSIMYKANLTTAINDEIKRDIEKLKIELWNEHYKPPQNQIPAYYETETSTLPSIYCYNVINTFNRLPGSKNRVWIPGSNQNSYQGQIRNKVFRGSPVKITRNINSQRPMNIGSDFTVDKSIIEVRYNVEYQLEKFKENIQWTSIELSSEAHSWCPPKGH